MVLDYLNRGHFVKLPPDEPVLWTRWHFVKHLINQSYGTRCSARPPNAKTNSESAESLPLLLFFHWMILSKRYYLAHTLFFRFDIVLGGDFSHMWQCHICVTSASTLLHLRTKHVGPSNLHSSVWTSAKFWQSNKKRLKYKIYIFSLVEIIPLENFFTLRIRLSIILIQFRKHWQHVGII